MRRLLALMVVLSMLLVFTAACGNGDDDPDVDDPVETGDTDDTDVDAPGDEEPLPLHMALFRGPKTEGTWVQEQVEERTNVEFEFTMLPSDADDAKVMTNLILNDPNDMPDVFYWRDMDREFQEWINAGILVDMLPLIAEYGNEFLEYYTAETLFFSYHEDGGMYRMAGDISEPGTMTTILRKDWMEYLNLEEPTNMEEFLDVLWAFTYDDPNQTESDDTIGFSSQSGVQSGGWNFFAPFTHPFKVDPNNFMIAEDGTVKHGSVMPQMKDALLVMQEAYEDGLIDPAMMTPNDFWNEGFPQGRWGATYYWVAMFNPNTHATLALKANHPDAELLSLDPIAGPDGFASDVPSNIGGNYWWSMTTANEEPERAMQFMNQLASAEIYELQKFGEEGVHYDYEDDGNFQVIVDLEDAPQIGLNLLDGFMNRKDESNLANTPDVVELFNRRDETSQAMREHLVFFKETVRPMWVEYSTEILDLREQIFYGIIVGDRHIDEFDDYVENFYAMGGDMIEDEANELYSIQEDQFEEFMDIYNTVLLPGGN